MTLCDNNNYNINHNNNNNNTDTSNPLFEHRHLNINQYTQPIRFNIVRDNIHDTIIQNMNTTSGNLRENHNGMEDLDSNNMDMCLNVNNISSTPNAANSHSDNCINDQPSITVIPYSLDPVSLASTASRQFHTNLTVLTSSPKPLGKGWLTLISGKRTSLRSGSAEQQNDEGYQCLTAVMCFCVMSAFFC